MALPFGPYIKSVNRFTEACLPEGKKIMSMNLSFDIDTPKFGGPPFNYPTTATNTLIDLSTLYGWVFDPTVDSNGKQALSEINSLSWQYIPLAVNAETTPIIFLYCDFSQQLIFLEAGFSQLLGGTVALFCPPGGHVYVLSGSNQNGYINLNFANFFLPAYTMQ